MDLHDYIESGIIESYLLGLASPEEKKQFEQMRLLHPQLNMETTATEKKLQHIVTQEGVTPPEVVWNKLSRYMNWEEANQPGKDEVTYVLQSSNNTMVVSAWWRCAFIALCVILLVLLASTVYFYRQFRQMEEQVMQSHKPAADAPRQTR